MKKFGKFIFTTLSIAAFIGGAFYFVKNVLNKKADDDFDDFDDDFDDFNLEEDEDEDIIEADRGYVTLNIPEEEEAKEDSSCTEDTKEASTESTAEANEEVNETSEE